MLGLLAGLGAAFCWATAPSLYVLGMKDTSPLLANAIRTITAGLFSILLVILVEDVFNQLPFDLIQVVFLVAITFLSMGLGDWLYLQCLKSTEVSFVVGITSVYPLLVAMLTILLGTEQLTPLAIFAAIIIVSGVFLISTTKKMNAPQPTRNLSSTPDSGEQSSVKPIIYALLAAWSWAITMFGLVFSLRYFSPLTANAIRISSVGVILFLIFFLRPRKAPVKKPSRASLAFSTMGGILGLSVGSWLMLVAITLLGAARSSALFSVSPLFTSLVAILVLKEKPTLTRLGGILLVCLGVYLISVS